MSDALGTESPQPPLDPGEFEVAGTAADAIEAELLRAACEEAGIPAFVQSPRDGMVGKLSSPTERWEIRVPERDLGRAAAFLAERKAALEADPEGAERAATEASAADTDA